MKTMIPKRLIAGIACICCLCHARETKRPNIILICSDDHRADLMGNAGHPYISTPNLDALANHGVRFSKAMASSPTCTPSRSSILTGKYAERTGAARVSEPYSFLRFQHTFPEFLHENGYKTAMIGKWHLGEGGRPKPGYDSWISWHYNLRERDGSFFINNNGTQDHVTCFIDDYFAEKSAEFIKESSQGGEPFFLLLNLTAPHLPYDYPERLAGRFVESDIPRPDTYDAYKDYAAAGRPMLANTWIALETFRKGIPYYGSWDNYIKKYYRSAEAVDSSVGTVVSAVKDAGLWDDTVIIYTSDHGYNNGEYGLTEKHYGYGTVMNVPLIVREPGAAQDAVCRNLVGLVDLAPTLLDLAGVDIPNDLNGMSFSPLIRNPQGPPVRETLFFSQSVPADYGHNWPHTVIVDNSCKLMDWRDGKHYELYNYVEDPEERRNLADDPDFKNRRDQMITELARLKKEAEWGSMVRKPLDHVYRSKPITTDRWEKIQEKLAETKPETIPELIEQTGLDFERADTGKNKKISVADGGLKKEELVVLALPVHVKNKESAWVWIDMNPGDYAIAAYDNGERVVENQRSALNRGRSAIPTGGFFRCYPPLGNGNSLIMITVSALPEFSEISGTVHWFPDYVQFN
jgi:arylsulfatase A-like enzyme